MRNRSASTGDQNNLQLETDEQCTAEEATKAAGVGVFQVKLIILSGLVSMTGGFQMVITRWVTPLLACPWRIQRWHGALLDTVTFISSILGCILIGIGSDKYGRRTALYSSLIFLFVCGAVSAGLPNYKWFIVFRTVVSFAFGGFPQTWVLCCEFFPSKKRGQAIYALSFFWSLGLVVMIWALYSTIESANGWRLFVAIGVLPAFIAMCLMRFFPESFRYLMVVNKYIAANDIMAKMTEENDKNVTAMLLPLPSARSKSLGLDFFRKPFVRSSVLLWLMGFATAISYLGMAALTPHIVHKGVDIDKPENMSSTMNFMGDMYKPIDCIESMSPEEFKFMMWTIAMDFPALVIYMILVDVVQRQILLWASYVLISIFIFLLFVPHSVLILHIACLYFARALLYGQFDLILLIVAETFPTSHRGTAVGMEVATFLFAQFLSSYINQALMEIKIMYYLILYGALTFLSSFCCCGLKFETVLQDIIEKHSEKEVTKNDEDNEENHNN